ncbi:MAG: hypothetical protein LBR16_05405 [Treponema sp.]|jgi:hypothetical protein|nr:hypothetical protein [Treponema sp.]
MAANNSTKALYLEKIRPYSEAVKNMLKGEEAMRAGIGANPEDAPAKRLQLAEAMLNLASLYIVMNGVSVQMLKSRDEEALNDARKSLYKAMICLEETVTSFTDVPVADYAAQLDSIAFLSAQKRCDLVRKMGLAIQLLEEAYGENTKWKWSFVELEGRHATIAKNLLDLRTAVASSDPRAADYEPTIEHLGLIKKLLNQAADRYREKYELSTSNLNDFLQAIRYLGALRHVHIALEERFEAEEVKKKYDVWDAMIKTAQKKAKEEAAS